MKHTMTILKKLACLVLCTTLVLSLAACTVSVADGDTPNGIGLSLAAPDSAWGAALTGYAQAAAEALSLPLYVAEPATDGAGQAAGLETLMKKGAKVLVVEPIAAEALSDVLARARAARVQVISLEQPIERAVCHISSDSFPGGPQAARYLSDVLGEGAKAALLEANPESSAGFLDVAGIRLEISARQTVAGGIPEAKAAMAALLKEDSTLQGVFVSDSTLAQGALEAMTEEHQDLVLVGCGISYEVLKAIREGRMDAAIAPQPELLAKTCVETAAALLQGQQVPSQISVEMALVTSQNAEEYGAFVDIPEYAIPCDVGLSLSHGADPFQAALRQGAEDAAADLNISLTVRDAAGDAAAQAAGIEAMLVKQIRVLLLSPVEESGLTDVLTAAREAGVRIVTLEQTVDDQDCHISVNDRQGGQLAAKFLLESIGEKPQVAMLEEPDSAQCNGFRTEDDIKLVSADASAFDREQAKALMLELLEDNGKLQAVFAASDTLALGALDALAEQEQTIPVVSYGGNSETLAGLEEGRLAAVISRQPELLGSTAMETAAKLLKGEDVEENISLTPILVVREAEEMPAEEAAAETTAQTVPETTEAAE